MTDKYNRFDVRLTDQERDALEKLAEKQGVTMSKWFKNVIRRAAKRAKVWK
jgi:predicted HicB family RNase H-like nuclease